MIHPELPVTDHKLLLQARLNQAQERYALSTVPRILSKAILSWAEEYVNRGGKFGEYMLEDLINRVQGPWYLESLAIAEGVADRFLEQCVEKTRLLCMGEAA